MDAAGFASVWTVFLSCCFKYSRAFLFCFPPAFFCALDCYIYWLGVVPFVYTFHPSSALFLAGLVRFTKCGYLPGFPMCQTNRVI